MIDAFRNLFGDMLSGKMKDAEISLTRQESANLRLKIDGLIDEGIKLRDERAVIIPKLEIQRLQLADKDSLIADLTAELQQRNPVVDGLDEEEAKILQFFFDAQESSREVASNSLQIPLPRATHYVGSLLKRSFLRQSTGSAGPRYPAKFRITHEGSSHIMKNG